MYMYTGMWNGESDALQPSAGEGGMDRPAAGNMDVEITVLLLLVNKQHICVTRSPIHCLNVAP